MSTADPHIQVPNRIIKPEDITLDDLHLMSQDSFALWALTSGVKVDNNNVDFNNHRYLLPIYLDDSLEIVWQKAAQLGATVYMLLRILWWLEAHQGRKAGLYFPTKEGTENLSKDRLTPLIQSCPSISRLTDSQDKLGLRKIGKSSFYLYHLGGVASKDSVPLDYIAFDEVRLCSAPDIDQALERVSHSPYKIKTFMSTAGMPDGDINDRFQHGTQHIWMSKCFTAETKIWVRDIHTNAVCLKSFSELQTANEWKSHQAMSVDTQHKKVVWRNITHLHNNGVQRTVRLHYKNGTAVECTPDHLFAVLSETNRTMYREAHELLNHRLLTVRNAAVPGYHPNSNRRYVLNYELCGMELERIEGGSEQQVFDITVDATEDRNHNFVLENGAVVHNCGCPDGCDLARTFPDCVVEDEKRQKLYLRCPRCKYVIKDAQNGRYVPHNPGAPYNSYHVSQLASKYMSLPDVWSMWKRTTNIEEFHKAKLGLPYVDEINRGVTKDQVEACINTDLSWGKGEGHNRCAMGVDQGAGYCMAIVSDYHNDKKRIRHVEIIEQHNPDYKVDGKLVTPFLRLRELMNEYNVKVCVVDAMPNVNDAVNFAQDYPGRVFLAHYTTDSKDVVQWTDKTKYKATVAKAGPLLKFKYSCVLSRFKSLGLALGEWANGDVTLPNPEGLIQMCANEKTDQIQPEPPARRMLQHLCRLIKRYRVTNEETGEGRHEWIFSGGDPHLAVCSPLAANALGGYRPQGSLPTAGITAM